MAAAVAWSQNADHRATMQWIRRVCVFDFCEFPQVDTDWWKPTRVRPTIPTTADRAVHFIEPYCPKLAAKLRSLKPPLPPSAAASASTEIRRQPVAPYLTKGKGKGAQKGKGT